MRKLIPFTIKTEKNDFKTFCEGGSPEYVSAKQKLKNLHLQHQNEYLSHRRNLTAYSLYINPLAFFDVNFMLIGAGVVLVAVIEKKLAENGIIGIAAILSSVLHMALPVVAFGSVFYLISQLGVFL